MKKILIVLITLLTCSALSAKKCDYKISFGSGGGVTGIFITYTFDSKVRLIVKTLSSKNSSEELSMLNKKQVQDICSQIKQSNFPSLKVDAPGNMSYYVNVTMNGKEYKTIWAAGPSGSGSKALDKLYDSLMSLVQKK